MDRLEPPPRDKSDLLDPPPLFSDRFEPLLALARDRLESDFFFSPHLSAVGVVATPDPPPIAAAAAIIRGLDKPRKRPCRLAVSFFPLIFFAGAPSFTKDLEDIVDFDFAAIISPKVQSMFGGTTAGDVRISKGTYEMLFIALRKMVIERTSKVLLF